MVTATEQINRLLRAKAVRENMPLEYEPHQENLRADTEEAKTRGWEAKQRRARKRPGTTPESQEKKSATDTFMGDLDDDED